MSVVIFEISISEETMVETLNKFVHPFHSNETRQTATDFKELAMLSNYIENLRRQGFIQQKCLDLSGIHMNEVNSRTFNGTNILHFLFHVKPFLA